MARMIPLWRFSGHGKIEKVRGASWPTGQHLVLRRGPRGRLRRKQTMVYPAAQGLRQKMEIDPNWERDDWEEFTR